MIKYEYKTEVTGEYIPNALCGVENDGDAIGDECIGYCRLDELIEGKTYRVKIHVIAEYEEVEE